MKTLYGRIAEIVISDLIKTAMSLSRATGETKEAALWRLAQKIVDKHDAT